MRGREEGVVPVEVPFCSRLEDVERGPVSMLLLRVSTSPWAQSPKHGEVSSLSVLTLPIWATFECPWLTERRGRQTRVTPPNCEF